jgi:hypothetical protein
MSDLVEVWERVTIALRFADPYEFVTPLERSTYPLCDAIVRQNWHLLATETESINSTAHRPTKGAA